MRARREALGLSREAVALAVARSSDSIALYERGVVAPPAAIISRLAAVLEVDPGDLFE